MVNKYCKKKKIITNCVCGKLAAASDPHITGLF